MTFGAPRYLRDLAVLRLRWFGARSRRVTAVRARWEGGESPAVVLELPFPIDGA